MGNRLEVGNSVDTRLWVGKPVNVEQFLVFKAHGLLYHSTLGSRVTRRKKRR